jgi:hypothetical protein
MGGASDGTADPRERRTPEISFPSPVAVGKIGRRRPEGPVSEEHIVEEGEHLAGIAAQHGFPSFKPIWDHADNAELRALRKTPNILLPGDRVVIPDKEQRIETGATEKRHTFLAPADRLELRVKVHDQGFRAIHDRCDLAAGSNKETMEQQGDIFRDPIQPDLGKAELQFPISQTERTRIPIPIEVGGLDPLDTLSGQQQRLNNLGYFAGFKKTTATNPKAVDEQMRWAVEEFQCDHMGPAQVDGVLGPNTLKKLKEVYGC